MCLLIYACSSFGCISKGMHGYVNLCKCIGVHMAKIEGFDVLQMSCMPMVVSYPYLLIDTKYRQGNAGRLGFITRRAKLSNELNSPRGEAFGQHEQLKRSLKKLIKGLR